MSRLLHRLALRARGAAPAIRPIVGWNAPAGHGDTGPHLHDPQPIAPVASAGASRTPAGQAWPAFELHEAPRVRDDAALAAPAPRIANASDEGPGPAHRVAPATASGLAAADRHAADPPAPGTALTATVDRRATVVEGLRSAAAPEHSPPHVHVAQPDRLLPLAQPASSAALPPAASTAGGRSADVSARAAGSAAEVHVTIGRIELTAVQEAPRPRREPARVRGPQSLDEYLARREAKRR